MRHQAFPSVFSLLRTTVTEGELIYTDVGKEMVNMTRGISQLIGQPQVAIERLRTTEAKQILALGNAASWDFVEKAFGVIL